MTTSVVTPRWNSFGSSPYVDRRLANPDEMGWGFTVGEWWEFTAQYMDYLSQRKDAPNSPEAYQLLAENARRLARKEPIEWAVNKFGYEKAKELGEKPFVPKRKRWYTREDGSEINEFGGVTDGSWVQYKTCLFDLIGATFGFYDHENTLTVRSGEGLRKLTLQEQIKDAERNKLPYQIIGEISG